MTPARRLENEPLAGTGFRALALIGGGSHSEVYRAEHIKLGTVVVVKVMRAAVVDAPGVAERMRLEAQALARLSHRNLVEVLDFDILQGRPLVAMEYLVGRTLKEELAARRYLPVKEAVDFARQMLAGLEVAHAAGLIHRDIQPGNLFLCAAPPGTPPGQRVLKILDFGLLRLLPDESPLGLEAASMPTADGITIGDPRYGAPEQATGRPVDATADLYAVGAVLYRMVAGREPYAHCEAISEVLRAKLERPPLPPARFSQQLLPHALDALILQALAKSPTERPPSARAFSESLARIAASAGMTCRPATDPSSCAWQAREAPPAGPWLSTVAMDPMAAERSTVTAVVGNAPHASASGERALPPKGRAGEALLHAGAKCGPYRIAHELGRGAMGVVYLAHSAKGEERAIKLLQLDARIRGDLAERFKREIQLLSYVDHVHVVRFYEAGLLELAGKPTLWVALEYLAGKTLRQLQNDAKEPIAVERIVRWGRQIAQGVHEVHKLGVIHRDLKPENISIVAGDIAKVFDFGIAKYRKWGVRATDLHRKLGTLPYMSPEQLDGTVEVDPRSDVFALGLILHELATGRHPFIDLQEPVELHEAILRQVTMPAGRLDQLVAGFPADVADAVERAVCKRPEDRFSSMAELAEALGESIRRLRASARAAALETGIGPAALQASGAREGSATIPAQGPGSGAPPLLEATEWAAPIQLAGAHAEGGSCRAPPSPGFAAAVHSTPAGANTPASPAAPAAHTRPELPKQTIRMTPSPSVPATATTPHDSETTAAGHGGVTGRGLVAAVIVAASVGAATTLTVALTVKRGPQGARDDMLPEATGTPTALATPFEPAPLVPAKAPGSALPPTPAAATTEPAPSAFLPASAEAPSPSSPSAASPSPRPRPPRPLPFGKPRF